MLLFRDIQSGKIHIQHPIQAASLFMQLYTNCVTFIQT